MMDTIKRRKKNTDISQKVRVDWNARLQKCLKERGYSQEEFAREYKKKYGTGSQSDVNRWLRVGESYGKAGKEIGLPSYDTMKRIADFFGVTVGYLTGETDYESFEIERACNLLGINEDACKAIMDIAKGRPTSRLDQYLAEDRREALCYLMSSNSFRSFIDAICELAVMIYRQKNPFDYFEAFIKATSKEITPEILELARNYKDSCLGEDIEDAPEITSEVQQAMFMLSAAEDESFMQEMRLDRDVRVARYDLSEKYHELIGEVVCDEHLRAMTSCRLAKEASLDEVKQLIKGK